MAYDQTLIHIRERSFLDLLDLALVVLRRRPWAVGSAAVAGIGPWAALYAGLASMPDVPMIFALGLAWMAFPWATAPMTVVLGGLMFGERPSAGRVLRTIVRALPALVLYQGLLRGFLLVTIFGIPIVPARLAFLNEVILLERGRSGGRDRHGQSVAGRCGALCGDRGGELFGQWMVLIVFCAMFIEALRWAIDSLIATLFNRLTWDTTTTNEFGEPLLDGLYWTFDFRDWTMQLGLWIVVTYLGVVRFLTYIDQRIRLEGWEVELRLRAAGAALEDVERW